MPTQSFSRGIIRIGKMTCSAYPTQWDRVLPDGSDGFVHYRSGELNVYNHNLTAIAHTDDFDTPTITLKEVMDWLTKEGFDVEQNSECL